MGFGYKPPVFDSKTAIFLSAISYQTYPFFFEGKLVLPKGFKLRFTIRAFADVENPTELVFGFIAESPDQIVVAFRGYASYPADLLASYDIFLIPYPFVRNGGRTSRGFTCLYRSTRNQIIRELNKLATTKKLYVTGHNYGGALATLAALDIAVNTRFKHPFVYTYGSPRIGDPDFVSRFNRTVTHSARIVNVHDSFPTFPARRYLPPFTKKGLIYRHVKTKIPITFQWNDVPRNDSIACYFKNLSRKNPLFAKSLCEDNPGFCPDTSMCFPFEGC
ncbi:MULTISPECIES: lipase family protein [unclassified Paenibacillus]|uniref:lipase family protein n=1 Tax=unclassified Paenibacillus TaxID=185978 RepID=UPI00055EF6E3|nr:MULTISPECIES: lipase family protein [unclassified Paenibacillus]OMF99505.1 lipase [Paenibacillus sp. FSL R7-0337]